MIARAIALLFLLAPPALAAPWSIDPGTAVVAEVGWQGRTVEVRFPTLSGAIDFDEARPERAQARITVAARDATTGVPIADALVRSPGFLDAERYPDMTFALDRLRRVSKDSAAIEGRITLRGVTRPINLAARVIAYGPAPENPAHFRAGFDLTGTLDRTEFGSTGGLPEVAAVIGLRIRLLMTSR
jgi:polyisoprenoid-binding protein YceI